MTPKPIGVQATMLVETAAQLMHRHRIRHLPALTEEGLVVGLVDDAAVFARGELKDGRWEVFDRRDQGLTVADVLRPAPVVMPAGTPLSAVLTPMVALGEDVAIVVDKARRPVGIFTAYDAVRAASSLIPEANARCAHELASPDVLTVRRDQQVGAALDTMRAHDIRHLVVVEGGKPFGVLSWRTLVEIDADQRRTTPIASLDLGRPVVVLRHATLFDVAEQMVVQKVGCLPVVDSAGHLVGIVSQTDLLRAMKDALEA